MGAYMPILRDYIVMMHEGLRICCFLRINLTFYAKKYHRDHIVLLRDHMTMSSELHGIA